MEEREFQVAAVEATEEILKKIGVSDVKTEIRAGRDGLREVFVISITVPREDSKLLIGAHGVTLFGLQHLIQAIAKRKASGYESFSIDINSYWKEKQFLLERDAKEAAHEVISTGRPVQMRPMLPTERKIVHSILAENEKVVTESVGKGEDRKVIVKPASLV